MTWWSSLSINCSRILLVGCVNELFVCNIAGGILVGCTSKLLVGYIYELRDGGNGGS